ncbi:14709_t:CDS:2 [Cetraspora pellucida]|uniref:14709_t:CDS:1 n=1 Tax=Cetraspora pellucida TaxID=1433469 RepID=A0A9N9GU69_9GLOM|nr:14709_t:CDS:2 [Cetraspora pellucida]
MKSVKEIKKFNKLITKKEIVKVLHKSCTKKRTSASNYKGAKHVLPSLELNEEQRNILGSLSTPSVSSISSDSSTSSTSNVATVDSYSVEPHSDELHLNKPYLDETCLDTLDDNNILSDPDLTFLRLLEDAISQTIYGLIEKVKYPSDKRLMQVCYDALLDMKGEEFINKIKHSSWKHFFNKHIHTPAQKFCHQGRSNIVQHIKDSIHVEFKRLIKLKRENHQVTHDEEQRFKYLKITQECYSKLNSPVDVNDNPNYTYLNFILDHAFPDPKMEKNSIAFGMTVVFNYLNSTKEIIIVPSKIVEKINYCFKKMNVSDRESCE